MKSMPQAEKLAWLNIEPADGVKLSKILYSNTAQFRELLVALASVY